MSANNGPMLGNYRGDETRDFGGVLSVAEVAVQGVLNKFAFHRYRPPE